MDNRESIGYFWKPQSMAVVPHAVARSRARNAGCGAILSNVFLHNSQNNES